MKLGLWRRSPDILSAEACCLGFPASISTLQSGPAYGVCCSSPKGLRHKVTFLSLRNHNTCHEMCHPLSTFLHCMRLIMSSTVKTQWQFPHLSTTDLGRLYPSSSWSQLHTGFPSRHPQDKEWSRHCCSHFNTAHTQDHAPRGGGGWFC